MGNLNSDFTFLPTVPFSASAGKAFSKTKFKQKKFFPL